MQQWKQSMHQLCECPRADQRPGKQGCCQVGGMEICEKLEHKATQDKQNRNLMYSLNLMAKH